MNYFQLYGIHELFNVDEAVVKRKFYELSKKYHPDFYINETAEKQQEILELSTLNNKAYQVLSNSGKRVEYILQLNAMIAEGEKYKLPQGFLMEMMDVNEAIIELEFNADPEALNHTTKQIKDIEVNLSNELNSLSSEFETADETAKESILLKIKDLWYRQKYLLRIRDSLNKFAAR